jgi:hypothetical protein
VLVHVTVSPSGFRIICLSRHNSNIHSFIHSFVHADSKDIESAYLRIPMTLNLPTCGFPRHRIGQHCRFPRHRINLHCGFPKTSSLPTSRIPEDTESAYIADSKGQFGNFQSTLVSDKTLSTMPILPNNGVPALSTSSNNFQEWKARHLTHTMFEGLTNLIIIITRRGSALLKNIKANHWRSSGGPKTLN